MQASRAQEDRLARLEDQGREETQVCLDPRDRREEWVPMDHQAGKDNQVLQDRQVIEDLQDCLDLLDPLVQEEQSVLRVREVILASLARRVLPVHPVSRVLRGHVAREERGENRERLESLEHLDFQAGQETRVRLELLVRWDHPEDLDYP